MSHGQAAWLVAAGAVSYGLLASIAKIGYAQGFHVGEIIGSQMLIGVVLLWLLAWWRARSDLRLSWRRAFSLLAVGTLSGVTSILYYESLTRLPTSLSIVLLFQFVWVGVLYEWMFDRVKPGAATMLSLAVSLAGGLLAANVIHANFAGMSGIGIAAGLGSAFSYGGTLYASGRTALTVSPWLRASLMGTGALAIVWIALPPVFLVSGRMWELSWVAVSLAILGIVIPLLCFVFGAPVIGTRKTTMLCAIELPVAVLLGKLVFAEIVDWLQWIGVAFIIAGLLMRFMWNGSLTKESRGVAYDGSGRNLD